MLIDREALCHGRPRNAAKPGDNTELEGPLKDVGNTGNEKWALYSAMMVTLRRLRGILTVYLLLHLATAVGFASSNSLLRLCIAVNVAYLGGQALDASCVV